jgi:hypothetical protein
MTAITQANLARPFGEVMGDRIPGTDVREVQVYMLGRALMDSIGAYTMLGLESPAHALDYTHRTDESAWCDLVLDDFIAVVSHRKSLRPGCKERLERLSVEWQRVALEKAYALLFPDGGVPHSSADLADTG